MDLSCIISSGDLELYVLGMLPTEEAAKITRLAEIFPEVEEEISRITQALQGVAEAELNLPSPALKNKILTKLGNLHHEDPPSREVPVVEMKPAESKRPSWMSAASIAILLGAAGFMYMYKVQMDQSTEMEQLQASLQQTELQLQQQYRRQTEDSIMMAMFENSVYRKIKLKALPGGQPADVQLFWDTKTADVYLGQMRLPEIPDGKQYQLWAIVDGKPVDAGMISRVHSMQKMRAFAKAEAFAITLEKEGGSPSPTMEAMIVMANT